MAAKCWHPFDQIGGSDWAIEDLQEIELKVSFFIWTIGLTFCFEFWVRLIGFWIHCMQICLFVVHKNVRMWVCLSGFGSTFEFGFVGDWAFFYMGFVSLAIWARFCEIRSGKYLNSTFEVLVSILVDELHFRGTFAFDNSFRIEIWLCILGEHFGPKLVSLNY